jgi:hypothetical protein
MKTAAVILTGILTAGVFAQGYNQTGMNQAVAAGIAQPEQPAGQAESAASPTPPSVGLGKPPTNPPAEPMTATRVKVNLSGNPEILEALRPALTAPFHALGDVQIVQDDPDWTIEIITTPLIDENQKLAAVGLSFVIQQHWPHNKMMLALAQACRYFLATGYLRGQELEYEMARLLRGTQVVPKPEGLAVVFKHRMAVVTPDKLGAACQDIVNTFNQQRVQAEAQYSNATDQPSTGIADAQVARN